MRPELRVVPGLSEALPVLESSLLDDPSPRNVVRVAEAYWLVGESAKAVGLLEPLVAELRSAIAARILLGWCYEAAERDADAARMWAEVHRLDPGNSCLGEAADAAAATAGTPEEVDGEPLVGPVPPLRSEEPDSVGERPPDPEREAEPEAELSPDELQHVPPAHLYSATLAEIFERQGFAEKALEIYREIVRQNPERRDLTERIALLEEGERRDSPS